MARRIRRVLLSVLLAAMLAWPQFPTPHSITLSWTASTTLGVNYNVYRATVTGGPYTKLNSAPVAVLTFTDTTGVGGTTYFYVVTAVDSLGNESVASNEASAKAVGNPNPPSGLTAVAK